MWVYTKKSYTPRFILSFLGPIVAVVHRYHALVENPAANPVKNQAGVRQEFRAKRYALRRKHTSFYRNRHLYTTKIGLEMFTNLFKGQDVRKNDKYIKLKWILPFQENGKFNNETNSPISKWDFPFNYCFVFLFSSFVERSIPFQIHLLYVT